MSTATGGSNKVVLIVSPGSFEETFDTFFNTMFHVNRLLFLSSRWMLYWKRNLIRVHVLMCAYYITCCNTYNHLYTT